MHMRTKVELEAEYRDLCARLGDLTLKREDLAAEESRLRARVAALNVEAQILAAREEGGGA